MGKLYHALDVFDPATEAHSFINSRVLNYCGNVNVAQLPTRRRLGLGLPLIAVRGPRNVHTSRLCI